MVDRIIKKCDDEHQYQWIKVVVALVYQYFDQTDRKRRIRDILRDGIVRRNDLWSLCGSTNENDDTKNDTVYHHPSTTAAIMMIIFPLYKDDVDADEEQ